MKNYICFISILVAIGSLNANAQNIPDGSGLPSGSLTGKVPRPLNFDQSPNVAPTTFNFTREYVPLKPLNSLPTFETSNGLPILVSTTYRNGFGNPLMSISRQNAGYDLMSLSNTRFSKTSVGYLPYPFPSQLKFQNTLFSSQQFYYLTKFSSEDTTAYSKTVSYSDQGMPTQRSYNPGKAFVGQERGTTTTSNFNVSGEVYILVDSIANVWKTGTYPDGTLMVSKTAGEHGHQTKTFSDKNGRLICKKAYAGIGHGNNGWLETYYVYNFFGKLTYIVPPKAAVQYMSATSLTHIDTLCYSYKYNKHGEIIKKNTPGKTEPEAIVYDRRHRPVLIQTPLLKNDDKFAFTIYDKKGRVRMSGILNSGSAATYWQSELNDNNTSIPIIQYIYEGFDGSLPSSITNCDIQTYNYYDSYSNAPATTYYDSTSFANDFFAGTQMIFPKPYYFTHNKLVASKVKIMDNGIGNNFVDSFITSVFYYDENGRTIQSQTLNPWNTTTWDKSAVQYNFSGDAVLSISEHTSWGSTNKLSTKIQTWSIFDSLSGRLTETKQKYDSEQWRSINSFTYNQLGQVSKKWLGGIEEQQYKYDIAGKLISTNGNYISTPLYPTMTYAEVLSYEKGFTDRRFDGAMTGYEWKSASSDQSAYGYTYDTLGRMTSADYRDWSTYSSVTGWNKDNKDYSVSHIGYDINGNMLSMSQRGPDGNGDPATIDSLDYDYDAGNQLTHMLDDGTDAPDTDDFDNTTHGHEAYYTYDADGNLAEDDLKGVQITYNYQDLPLHIENSFTGAVVENIYDASGTLIQKIVDDDGSVDTFIYWGPYVYKNSLLQYVLHDEGRSRWISDSLFFKNDFFVKDHLGNVRTVVSYELQPVSVTYLATHEIAVSQAEESIFDHISDVRDSKPAGTPGDVDCATLNATGSDTRIGTALLLSVMAGDKFNVGAYSYHEAKNEEEDNYTMPEEMLSTLLSTLTGGVSSGGEGEDQNVNIINNLFNTGNYDVFNEIKNGMTNSAYPRAFLNYLVFDEDYNLDVTASGAIQVHGNNNSWESIGLPSDLTISQNGYIAFYLSNEETMNVSFDNMSIVHTHGRLIEEMNYYPHGLLTAKTRATTGADPENKFQYQGKLMQEEAGMELYDFHARQYDPQIGRFWGIDPADQFPSGYTGMGNDPANMIDPSGMYANFNGFGGYNQLVSINRERARVSYEAWSERMHSGERFDIAAEANIRPEEEGFELSQFDQIRMASETYREEAMAKKAFEAQQEVRFGKVTDRSENGVTLYQTNSGTWIDGDGNLMFEESQKDAYVARESGIQAKERAVTGPVQISENLDEATKVETQCKDCHGGSEPNEQAPQVVEKKPETTPMDKALAASILCIAIQPEGPGELAAGAILLGTATYIVTGWVAEKLHETIDYYKEHTNNKRESNRAKHEAGDTRRQLDGGGAKGMKNPPRQRPKGWTGPWPPKR